MFGLATPETMTKAHPDKVKGITFSMGEALYADAQKQIDELTEAGCDLIVALGHLGVSDESEPNRSIDVMNNVTGLDLFIDGHSHTAIDGGETVNGALLTSTGNYSEAIGYVIVDITKEDDKVEKSLTAGLTPWMTRSKAFWPPARSLAWTRKWTLWSAASTTR